MTSLQPRAYVSRAGRYASAGAAIAGFIGALAGLVIGLDTYAPTAWFAVFEIGIPAAMVGGLLGLLVAGAVHGWRHSVGGR
ncbi:hypothetical protein [Nocardioides baekrokdamisoli]|uniref:hypothetical protein n=1 Tax=Nocardioides baekrokdamisoli TaxID=1804624 RepID=UPI000F7AEEFE|nr:hypothetical protein [Nocardioides baekrokdamisoli]